MRCIECGEKSKEGYWNEKDWVRLSITVEIGPDSFSRSGLVCPTCSARERDRWTARAAKEEKA